MADWRKLSHRALIAILVTGISGCTQWRVASEPSRDALAAVGDRRVRVALRDGGQVEMHAPRIIGDSVVGYEAVGEKGERRAVALAQVAQVERQVADGELTLWTVGLIALSAVVAFYAWVMFAMGTAHT